MSTYKTFGEYRSRLIETSLFGDEIKEPIIFRPEQSEAIQGALNHFCTSTGRGDEKTFTPRDNFRQFLWNAKMRFGKTLCALELAKRMGVKRTLIVTHRPVVDKGWHEDFHKIFDGTDYRYATRTDDESSGDFYRLDQRVINGTCRLIFFVSMQYLRRSTLVGGDTEDPLKEKILKTDWDLVVVDEAHEGTRTALGKRVIDEWLTKEKTKLLHLSGTPFNLYEDFEDKEIYTWDYTKEQRAKRAWAEEHPGEFNPYAELPHMNIYTYDLGDLMQSYIEEGQEFKFKEFLRVWTGNPKSDGAELPSQEHKGRFVHEQDVIAFLDLLCKKDDENNFPFSTDEYRRNFRHTLWVVPGVKEAKAMKNLLNNHNTFRRFNVINVAGEGDDDETRSNALDAVLSAIGETPERTSTITISCGRLTTGVTVKPWTAVFYMKGSDTTSPATFMQTIFRVQSPYISNDGKMKTECHVFDFLPNRMLNAITETAKFASLTQAEKRKASTTDSEVDKNNIREFLKYCNVISLKGGKMSPYDAETLFNRLHEVYIDRLVRKGFDDQCLYVQEELNKIDPELINHIGEHGGKAPDEKREKANKTEPIDLGHMTPEQRAKWEEKIRRKKEEAKKKAEEKARKDEEYKKWWDSLEPEEKEKELLKIAEKEAQKEEKRKQREEFRKRITNIRGIALRIPLLMYGGADAGDTSEDLTVDNFTRKIKDESWAEFMPPGIKKTDFNKIKKCFNAARFEEAGKRIRALAREADEMHILERIERISWIFSTFHNPDKETVLTPWPVVNMHMSDTIGGYCFFNERFDGANQKEVPGEDGKLFDYIDTNEPRFVPQGEITDNVFNKIATGQGLASRVLEINSKTGLYPLYVSYTMYRHLLHYYEEEGLLDNPVDNISVDEEHAIWDDVVTKNVFVICNTPMAAGITRRTLMGFREPNKKINIKSDKLIERAKDDREGLIAQIKSVGYWNGTTSNAMINFDAVVGNPPYQGTNHQQLYPYFYVLSKELGHYVSLIFPVGWQEPKTANNLSIMNSEEIKADKQIHFIDNRHNIFPKVSGVEWTNFVFWEKGYDNGLDGAQLVYTNGKNPIEKKLNTKVASKPDEIVSLGRIVTSSANFKSVQEIMSMSKPYGIRKDVFARCDYYNLPEMNISKNKESDLTIYGSNNAIRYVPFDYPLPRRTSAINKYKVFVGSAWGNWDEKKFLGGAFADLRVGKPSEICTETYQESGCFDDYDTAYKHAKYLLTKFARACLYVNKLGQMSTTAWGAVPVQDYKEDWWDKPISSLEQELFDKYKIPDNIRYFILEKFQTKSEDNIIIS